MQISQRVTSFNHLLLRRSMLSAPQPVRFSVNWVDALAWCPVILGRQSFYFNACLLSCSDTILLFCISRSLQSMTRTSSDSRYFPLILYIHPRDPILPRKKIVIIIIIMKTLLYLQSNIRQSNIKVLQIK